MFKCFEMSVFGRCCNDGHKDAFQLAREWALAALLNSLLSGCLIQGLVVFLVELILDTVLGDLPSRARRSISSYSYPRLKDLFWWYDFQYPTYHCKFFISTHVLISRVRC